MRQTSVRFKTLCDDILVYSKKHHRDFRSVEIRVKKVVAGFGEKPADKIKPAEIDEWLSKATKTPATSNRYRALFSLIFREAIRNGKLAIIQPGWCDSAQRTMDGFASLQRRRKQAFGRRSVSASRSMRLN